MSAECSGALFGGLLSLEKLTHGRVSLELLGLDQGTIVLSKVDDLLSARQSSERVRPSECPRIACRQRPLVGGMWWRAS
jgi:hypothetical protein